MAFRRRETLKVLRRTSQPLRVRLTNVDNLISISGWSVLKNLTTLDLSESGFPLDQNLSDLSPLRELTSLTMLNLSEYPGERCFGAKELEEPHRLDLSRTPVSDVSPLKELKNLTTLNLSHTPVSDVSPLKELNNLTTLTSHRLTVYSVLGAVSNEGAERCVAVERPDEPDSRSTSAWNLHQGERLCCR